ncbi:MAG TPA: hypothetical protein VGM11_13815 [Acidobacteriaceae bacterium]
MRTITMPAGKTLENALKKQVLGQDGAPPFHVVLEISQAKAADAQYTATIEETWLAKDRWVRTVHAQGLDQTVIANETGMHYVTVGDYFPLWLRSFELGMFSPVAVVSDWTRGHEVIEQKVFPNGMKSTPCIHREFMLGEETKQVNFANLCFNADGLFDMVQGPEFAVEFSDYSKFQRLEVPHTLAVNASGGVRLVGKIAVLESVAKNAAIPQVPNDAVATDPLRFVVVSAANLEKLAGDQIAPAWPARTPGSGQMTFWVGVDRAGKVREVETRNTDLSGFADDMAKTVVGRQWRVAASDGAPVQVEGPLVYSYPPAAK